MESVVLRIKRPQAIVTLEPAGATGRTAALGRTV
jgi:hypothetical protein